MQRNSRRQERAKGAEDEDLLTIRAASGRVRRIVRSGRTFPSRWALLPTDPDLGSRGGQGGRVGCLREREVGVHAHPSPSGNPNTAEIPQDAAPRRSLGDSTRMREAPAFAGASLPYDWRACQLGRTFVASGPLRPGPASNSTF